MAGKDFEAFKKTIEQKFMGHPVVTRNDYTAWFAHGDMPLDHLRRFTVQFSVFSNQFLLAALNRVINADTLHSARESKEILMNELGVIYNKGGNGTVSDSSTIEDAESVLRKFGVSVSAGVLRETPKTIEVQNLIVGKAVTGLSAFL